jgi:DNA-binding response OmpR family regulator
MRKILLVEDEPSLRQVYEVILSTEPYDITTASNGQEALDACAATTFDLILLDLMMPTVSGIEFLERYTSEGYTPSKIIVLSNVSTSSELTKAMNLGVYKNILKADLSPRQLLTMVRYELEV